MDTDLPVDLTQARRLVVQLRARVDQLKLERDTFAQELAAATANLQAAVKDAWQARAADADLRTLLAEFLAYHTVPGGLTPEIVRDRARFDAFTKAVHAREQALVARARALLDGHTAPPGENPYDYMP